MNGNLWMSLRLARWALLFSMQVCLAKPALAATNAGEATPSRPRPGWERREAHWRLPDGQQISAIHEPRGKAVRTRKHTRPVRPVLHQKRAGGKKATLPHGDSQISGTISAYVVDSPPIDGFVPWLAVSATNKKQYDSWEAFASTSVQGPFLPASPEQNYSIGLLDTGAGVSVLSNQVATDLNIFASGLVTDKTVQITGVTGSVDAWVSQPYGLWVSGLGSIDPSTLLLNTGQMVGEWNVSTALGDIPAPGAPDLATAIGAPMAVYFANSVRNDLWHRIVRNGQVYEAPDIQFLYPANSTAVTYPNSITLELRPLGSSMVLFLPCFFVYIGDPCLSGSDSPGTPTLIAGVSYQSLFFLGSVNLSDEGHSVDGRSKFMLDTGAQVTVVGTIVGNSLGLSSAAPDFEVEIQGLDGQVVYKPGFYVDSLDIPGDPVWLSYTNVPVVMMNIASPEGGTLDGIIGMNLLNRYNFIVRGALEGQGWSPSLDFAPLPAVSVTVDVTPDWLGATWTLEGAGGYSHSGVGDETIADLDPGSYTLTWDDVDCWTTPTPNPDNRLPGGGSILFEGTYVPNTAQVTSWQVAATHGADEVYSIIPEGGVESRGAGISRLRVCLDRPMDTSISDPAVVGIAGLVSGDQSGLLQGLDWASDTCLDITLNSALPDEDTYTVTVSTDLHSAAGCPLGGDRDHRFSALVGDVDGDCTVSDADIVQIGAHRGQAIDENTCRFDVNCDGAINVSDVVVTRDRRGHICP